MLHFVSDGASGHYAILLPLETDLVKVIPATMGYTNLTGNLHREVLELVINWREKGWVSAVCKDRDWGDSAILSSKVTVCELGVMCAEWFNLQQRLR